MKTKYVVGSTLKDTITGFEGVAIGVTVWLNGCVRYSVQTRELYEGKPIAALWFDEEQLEMVDVPPVICGEPSGGPMPDPSGPTQGRE